ncbi:hypothetical protein HGRIS_006027 [Hohenbuehelia grisea]|uniref:YhhN-like protein n=1 Tax=Hohenbuehelia grisea TaxID=104357 RepID=A0ABR3K119_9AGAR
MRNQGSPAWSFKLDQSIIMHPGVIITSVALVLLLLAEYQGNKSQVWVWKPLASCGFLFFALKAPKFDAIMFTGLCLAWLGDVLLIPADERIFQAGIASFLFGHVFYAIAFYQNNVIHARTAALAIAPLAVIFAAVNHILSPNVPSDMQIPVIAYMFVISAMVDVAIATHDTTVIVGALLFYISDFLVARDQFLSPGFSNKAVGLPLYYGAQLILGWTLY